jgi:hypothetical protein
MGATRACGSWRMRSVMSSKGRSRLCAVWKVDSRSPMPFETCSPTTSTLNGMERLIGTPVERIIARMERISSRGRA